MSDPFGSPEAFRDAFEAGLQRLLEDEEGLGPFILALANATFDPAIRDRLRHHLVRRFGELAEQCRKYFVVGREPEEPPDDLAVFLRLMAIGFEAIETRRQRTLDPWEIQFNQVRSLRPKRTAGLRPSGIQAPFDEDAFHFNKPFLRKETFWSGTLEGLELDLLYNKFPFVDLHTLLVPRRRDKQPQVLNRERHRQMWSLCEHLARRLPSMGLGYNSYGAYASVNHLHFQLFLRCEPLPVASPRWRHNGGTSAYPARCERFEDLALAWERIADLQRRGISYNLVYLPGTLFCLPRKRQGTYDVPEWSGGQGWYEMAGGVVAFDLGLYHALSAGDVHSGLVATAEGLEGISGAGRGL
jgi:hypothetical protein